jgi:hypothetical protein
MIDILFHSRIPQYSLHLFLDLCQRRTVHQEQAVVYNYLKVAAAKAAEGPLRARGGAIRLWQRGEGVG